MTHCTYIHIRNNVAAVGPSQNINEDAQDDREVPEDSVPPVPEIPDSGDLT